MRKSLNRIIMHYWNNITKYYLRELLWNIIYLSLTGAILQTFLLEKGLSEAKTGTYFAAMQIVQMLTIFLFSFRIDKIKDIIHTNSFVQSLDIPIILFLCFMCFRSMPSSTLFYLLLLLFSTFFHIAYGIHCIVWYKLPYQVIPLGQYGQINAASGIINGITGFAFTVILSFMQTKAGYFNTMKYLYVAILLLLFLFIKVNTSLKKLNAAPNQESQEATANILCYKPFTKLMIPHFFRGFCLGIIEMAVTIGYFCHSIDSQKASILVILNTVVTIVGNSAYFFLSSKVKDKWILLIGSGMLFVFLPLMVTNWFSNTFLLFYAVVYFFYAIINCSVPVAVTKFVDYAMIGKYSSGRMLLNTLGVSLAGFVCIPLCSAIGTVPTLLLTGSLQLISGIGYYIYLHRTGIA